MANISVKDLTAAMQIGADQKEKELQIAAEAPTWPMDKWPHPTPGQGPLPNTELPPTKLAGAYDQYKPDKWETEYIDDIYKQYQERQNPEAPGEPEAIQMELPLDLVKQLMIKAKEHPDLVAGLMDDLKIDPTAHKGAQKKTKIYNKATQGSGSEKDWLKKTGPQLPPLASLSPEAQIELMIKGVKTFKEGGGDALRNLLKPHTKPDQFGHPTGSFKSV